ncbi:MAG: hypothetical protein K1X29_05215 [Bdellovibrionales bacterium]|nr:hypothetical protein [Bdellovibrionales bacterium]
MHRFSLLLFLLFWFECRAFAHPVSYKDAFGIMSYNSSNRNELLLTYSINHKFAVAHTYLLEYKSEFFIPRANFLLKRWNQISSQANVYLSLGSGFEKFKKQVFGAHLAEIVLDWESRKYYSSFEGLILQRDNGLNIDMPHQVFGHGKIRLGMAPFLADYEDLNIWFITQFDGNTHDKAVHTTQLLRFYRKNVLWEIGASFQGSFQFNFMIHL